MTNSGEKSVYEPKKVGCIAMAFPFVFMIIGLVLFYFGVIGVIEAVGSNYWQTVPGKIIASDIISGGNTNSTVYSAYIKYEYKIKDVIYSGNKISYGDYISVSQSRAKEIVDKYPTGTDVTIHYSINDPVVSVLEPGVKLQTLFLPSSGFAILILGLFAFLANKKVNQRAVEHQVEEVASAEPGNE